MRNRATICITGGHLTPALAIMEEIQYRSLPWRIVFLGRSHAFEGVRSPTQEERLVRALGASFHALETGRGRGVWKVPLGIFQSLLLLSRYRPAAVLTFGGYVAFPVATAAWILGIPVLTHEQTGALGLANRIIARFAHVVLRAETCGVPLRRSLFFARERPRFSVDESRPILYITGGSTGSQTLNALVFPIVSQLTRSWTVIHQVGVVDRQRIPALTHSYVAAEYFDTADLAWIYRHAALVIGRSGANTVAEVTAMGIPALFVPLPWSAADEQRENARFLQRAGAAVVLEQETLTPDALLARITETMSSVREMRRRARAAAATCRRDGAQNVVQALCEVVQRGKAASPYR